MSRALRITSPDRVIDGGTGVTKIVRVGYCHQVGELMMWHPKGRPIAFVRAPARVGGKTFFQRSGPKNRVGRIFIDYLNNGLGAATVCAWSARARPGFCISVPVEWAELGSLRSGDHWTIRTEQARMGKGDDPWKGHAKADKTLTAAMKTLG